MKKNTLYTVNKWNMPAFMPNGNEYNFGSWLEGVQKNLTVGPQMLGDYAKTEEGSVITKGAVNGLGAIGGNAISGGYNTQNGRAWNSVLSTVGGLIPGPAGLLVTGIGKIGGGIINAIEGPRQEEARRQAEERRKEQERYMLAQADINDAIDYNNNINNNTMFASYENGGDIHIKKSNRGKFTAQAKRAGMGVQKYTSHVLAHKEDYPAQTVKRANFAHVFGGRNYDDGGYLLQPFFDSSTWKQPIPDTLTPIDYPTNGGTYGGGRFGGAGISTKFGYPDTEYEEVRDTLWLPLTQDFNTAFRNARKNKQKEFIFNGKRYSTKLGNNPESYKAGQKRTETVLVPWEYTRKQAKSTEKALGGPLVAGNPTLFALGGDVQMHGGDFTTGLSRIDAGLSHEENPYGGVQYGTDSQGVPNLLEQGEVVWNDYVFSMRIMADEAAKKKFHLPLKKEITYADIAKKIEREAAERPNDPISQAGLEAQMADLAEQQERQKQEMEAEKARRAFESLTPEEQTAVMQRVAEEETMAEQAALQQQQAMTQQPMQQPEGLVQQPEPMPEETMMQQAPVMGAMGGKVNRFDFGGELMNALDFYTKEDYMSWLDENGIKYDKDKETIDSESIDKWYKAIASKNPALADAMANGYDFGKYKPSTNSAYTINFDDAGNWNERTGSAWSNSKDAMYLEAVKKGLIKEGMSEKELEDVLKATDTYKKATDVLKNDEEARRRYFAGILNSKAPEAAKKYAKKFINEDGSWKEGIDRSYDNTMAAVRDRQPGSYWKTPVEFTRNSSVRNRVINDDGTVTDIVGNVPKDWKSAGDYTWQRANTDYGIHYYRRPVLASITEVTDGNGEGAASGYNGTDNDVVPVHRNENLMYMGLMGPLTALGLQGANFGRPDFTELDNIMNRANSRVTLARWRPIGDYLAYRPFDEWSQRNRNAANLNAGLRQIGNTVSPSKQAATVAVLHDALNADGQLGIEALMADDRQKLQAGEFNKNTNTYNATGFTQNSQYNTGILNQHNQFTTNLAANIAGQRMAADKDWYGSMYANMGNFYKGLHDLGRQNAEWNMVSDMWADGIAGTATSRTNSARGHLADKIKGTPSAKGGRIKRKKGLTY